MSRSTNEELNQKTDELCDELESFIRSTMRREFDQSTSITPGLWDRIEEENAPLLARIREYRQAAYRT